MNIANQRLHNQQLVNSTLQTPADVVNWFGAVQAQEYLLAKWALGLRLPGISDHAVEQAFTDGTILRTHVMRPTWHFVTAEDIRWILELTAPRVHALNAYMYRKLELDTALFVRSHEAITKALSGGKQLTRSALAQVLEQVGIQAEGLRLGYIVHHAELEAVICSGARQGKQFTYALLAERAPQARTLSHDEALAELTRRFFTSHGPATVRDFAWWSGLTQADARTGLEMVKPEIVPETITGETYWYAAALPRVDTVPSGAFLLPPYDEYGIAYRNHYPVLDGEYLEQAKNAIFGGQTVIDSKLVGNWRRTFSKGKVLIESAPFRPFSDDEQGAFVIAAERFGKFLGMPVEVV